MCCIMYDMLSVLYSWVVISLESLVMKLLDAMVGAEGERVI